MSFLTYLTSSRTLQFILIGLVLACFLPIEISVKPDQVTVSSFFARKIYGRYLFSWRNVTGIDSPQTHDISAVYKITTNATAGYNTTTDAMARTPVYFLSHGGPTIMEQTTHPAYSKLREIGVEITQKVKPKAVVVISAHWQGEPNLIEVNTAENMGLIYDFYGFPPHYYEWKYPHSGSPELAQRVLDLLENAGLNGEGVRRGLDHGVWAGFHCAFHPEENPLGVPIVQVSLYDSDDPDKHYALGQALQPLREEGIQIIASGMAVHNLRDFRKTMGAWGAEPKNMPYTLSFDQALKESVEQPPDQRQKAMRELLERKDARQAHPGFDHILPVHVAAGAAGDDLGRRLWTMPEGSMAWAQFRFGEIAG